MSQLTGWKGSATRNWVLCFESGVESPHTWPQVKRTRIRGRCQSLCCCYVREQNDLPLYEVCDLLYLMEVCVANWVILVFEWGVGYTYWNWKSFPLRGFRRPLVWELRCIYVDMCYWSVDLSGTLGYDWDGKNHCEPCSVPRVVPKKAWWSVFLTWISLTKDYGATKLCSVIGVCQSTCCYIVLWRVVFVTMVIYKALSLKHCWVKTAYKTPYF